MSMKDLIKFDSDGARVRVMTDDQGEPWWVVMDVCRALEIANASNVVARLDEADLRTAEVGSQADGQRRRINIVNESGLYDLIFESRKPAAKRFRRWVTSEVLPSIRQTGSYSLEPKPAAPPSGIDALRAMVEQLATVEEQARVANARINAIEGKRGWFSALGYCKKNRLRTDLQFTQALGTVAAHIGRSRGIVPNRVEDWRFGLVNGWPEEIWELAGHSFSDHLFREIDRRHS